MSSIPVVSSRSRIAIITLAFVVFRFAHPQNGNRRKKHIAVNTIQSGLTSQRLHAYRCIQTLYQPVSPSLILITFAQILFDFRAVRPDENVVPEGLNSLVVEPFVAF